MMNITPEEYARWANPPVMVYDHPQCWAVATQTQTYGEYVHGQKVRCIERWEQ